MLRIIQKFILRKFVLYVGDHGASLTLFKKNIPIKKIDVSGVHDEHIADLASLLRKYIKVSVYILADVSDQNFKQITIPSTNAIVVKKLVARRIAREFRKNDLHNYYQFKDTDNANKHNSNYIIANVERVPPLSEWLDYLKNISNTIDAVYITPIEIYNLPNDIELYLKNNGKATPSSRWKMVVVQSKVGGFRIVVTKDQQVLFTRMLTFELELDKEHIETLQNQIIGTVEYLRRIGFKDKHGIVVFLLFYDDLNRIFDTSKIKGYATIKVSEEELSSVIYGKKKPKEKLSSVEQGISAYFIRKGRFLGFYTKNLEAISVLNNINIGLTMAALFSGFFLVMYILINTHNINSTKRNIEKHSFKTSKLSSRLETIRQEKFGFDINEDKVIDVSKLHRGLAEEIIDPLQMVINLSSIKPDNITIRSYSWRHNQDNTVAFEVDAIFISKNLSYEELFTGYDSFIRELKTKFNKYNIEHSELPDTISFDLNLEDIPIDFQINEPNS